MGVITKKLDFISKIPRLPKDDKDVTSKPIKRYSSNFDSHSKTSSEHSIISESSMEQQYLYKYYKIPKKSYMKSREKQEDKTTIELLKARVFQLEEELSTQRAEVFRCKNQCKAVEDSELECNSVKIGNEMTYMEQMIQMQTKLVEALEKKTELLSMMTLMASFLALAVIVIQNR